MNSSKDWSNGHFKIHVYKTEPCFTEMQPGNWCRMLTKSCWKDTADVTSRNVCVQRAEITIKIKRKFAYTCMRMCKSS